MAQTKNQSKHHFVNVTQQIPRRTDIKQESNMAGTKKQFVSSYLVKISDKKILGDSPNARTTICNSSSGISSINKKVQLILCIKINNLEYELWLKVKED